MRLWGLLWRSENRRDGVTRHPIWRDGCPLIFRSRSAARAHAQEHYGYIGKRPDLRAEPHGWRTPLPVKIRVILEKRAAHE